jgi:hypothetical protein
VPIDLSKITAPAYFVSAIEDHIAPWKATYSGPQLFGGKSRFVLSGSGHIAGMINPPAANKYGYWTNEQLPAKPDEWLSGARQFEGSWWNDWLEWLKPNLGAQVAARVPGKGKLKVIEAAPGSYAKMRAEGDRRGADTRQRNPPRRVLHGEVRTSRPGKRCGVRSRWPGECTDCGSCSRPLRLEKARARSRRRGRRRLGGVIGHQIGGGTGKTLATIAGAGGGAYAGHQIEKSAKKKSYWSVTIKMDGGQTRSFTYSAQPTVKEGERVKLVDGGKRLALVAN